MLILSSISDLLSPLWKRIFLSETLFFHLVSMEILDIFKDRFVKIILKFVLKDALLTETLTGKKKWIKDNSARDSLIL